MSRQSPTAIIDIGSNSVRLVVYAGAPRVPAIIFNEKVMAGLGKSLNASGALSEEAQDRALAAMARFRILLPQMGVTDILPVATAAVRDASNGDAFLDAVRDIGFSPIVLSGEREGFMAGQGVLSAFPDADGLAGDLGGGSLELVDLGDGKVRKSASTRFGVLRLQPIAAKGEAAFRKAVRTALAKTGFDGLGRDRPFYMVGGSWRALAKLDMAVTDYPLPITHHYWMQPERPAELLDLIAELDPKDLKAIVGSSRAATLAEAAMLLRALSDELEPSHLVLSSFGIREGLLYDRLDPKTRARDPLIDAAREAGRGLGRFEEHGKLLDRWIAGALPEEDPALARLRLASCVLSDIAWRAHPDFRAERGVDMALHGNWVGIDAPGRVMIAQALFCNFAGSGSFAEHYPAELCTPEELERASCWGYAVRLAQRFSGGAAEGLERSRLEVDGNVLRLALPAGQMPLYGEAVEKRLKALAGIMELQSECAAI
ncbi:Ppx/GppA family phosphatase [Allosphingosinicella flava]|uniref:Ppx/GppA family phosphatase n=1 Tax=Allosphingosinicella flava TaxID=2771430 RepID=A0A7T2GKR0_9SPHN|nr:Ppx/GppA family phosphatase [Sphingosinicella flava]QPQ55665.1 Ppx/GppA family phosphatase [Sphingosinicella flava]